MLTFVLSKAIALSTVGKMEGVTCILIGGLEMRL